jgi:hypothetical protein
MPGARAIYEEQTFRRNSHVEFNAVQAGSQTRAPAITARKIPRPAPRGKKALGYDDHPALVFYTGVIRPPSLLFTR